MIDAPVLLKDCQRLVGRLEDDLRERLRDHPELDDRVRAEHERAQERRRTGQSYAVWRDEYLTQVAVHWVLAAVFVRFLEDNGLLPDPWLSGPGERLAEARSRHDRFFEKEPAASDREYLLACFREVEALPAMAPLFDERHNPVFKLGPSADGARWILDLFRKIDPASGGLVHDFVDESWNTRFLGNLYQDLSEAARKRYALLQTPEFVEEFILDRTLEPAMEEVGYQKVTLIDPACGSGHFLLGAFHRIFERWRKNDPTTNDTALARNALNQIAGVDLNPFAVAIARFRLLLGALKLSGIRRMADAPAFPLNVAAGDSLLHGGTRPGHIAGQTRSLFGADEYSHYYETEDQEELRRLFGRRYTVAVGNPPYITPKDPALNQLYRDRFGSCHRQYSLAIPFAERFFDLADRAGWVGMITANSFMKREFGKKLIEQYIPRWDLTHVVDTSGAYIPGHGTPTVLLIGRNRSPLASTIRTVMGIRGEPVAPADPQDGLVWNSILRHIDLPGSQNEFLSVVDIPRARLHVHPWSIGGGGASELKEILEETSPTRLRDEIEDIGTGVVTREDDVFVISEQVAARHRIPSNQMRRSVAGENIRDWVIDQPVGAIWPYDAESLKPEASAPTVRFLWPWRSGLSQRIAYSQTQVERGLAWFEYSMFFRDRYRRQDSIAYAEVATHNHFALSRGGEIFKQTAPVIKLTAQATAEDHYRLLGVLNSSTGWFWMKQVSHNKGLRGIGGGITAEGWEHFVQVNGERIKAFPIPADRPLEHARRLNELALELYRISPKACLQARNLSAEELKTVRRAAAIITNTMIALQEELDWQVYRLYGLIDAPLEADPDSVPEVALGERPFEIILARRMAAGEIETKWFERHGSTPIIDVPSQWSESYRRLVERRIETIEANPWIALIEQPEYKRRWNREPWEELEEQALRGWLLDRLEDTHYWPEPRVGSTAKLADRVRQDDEFRQVAVLFRGQDDFDWTDLITELVLNEAVPFLTVHRYSDSGLRKRAEWEETWRLQRLEDAGEKITSIPVPPKYAPADFRRPPYWRLRGKLDLPKERFILYPGLERGADRTPVIGWAGWDHLQQAQALATAYQDLREQEAWTADRLAPVLAGLAELIPWLQQWHNEPDPAHHGERLGDFFAAFLDEEARSLGLTREALAAWRPEKQETKRGRKKKTDETGLFEG